MSLILLQYKALGIWNALIQKSGFPKTRHYVGFLQIGSHYFEITSYNYMTIYCAYNVVKDSNQPVILPFYIQMAIELGKEYYNSRTVFIGMH